MNSIEYDIIARIRFLAIANGGKKEFISRNFYGCPMNINGVYYDCRLLLHEIKQIRPGDEITVPIKFLCSQIVLEFLKENDIFELWEGRIIANGQVIDINKNSR